MSDSERFSLDARIVGVLSVRAFVAELDNGHRLTAFVPAWDAGRAAAPEPGDRVEVECSPFDMSKARLVRAWKVSDESAQLGETNL